MNSTSKPSVRVVIVDSVPQDYEALLAAAGTPGVSIHFLSSGRDALRFARRFESGLWVINTELPDMTGFDLATMLRSIRRSALVFIIGDEYRLDDELQALTLGLAKYLCKPLEPSWVLPQRGDFCIPLPSYWASTPELWVVSPSEGDTRENVPGESMSESTGTAVPFSLSAIEHEDQDQVILPFNPDFPQRPAARRTG